MDKKPSGLIPFMIGVTALHLATIVIFGFIYSNFQQELAEAQALVKERTYYLGEAEDKIDMLEKQIQQQKLN